MESFRKDVTNECTHQPPCGLFVRSKAHGVRSFDKIQFLGYNAVLEFKILNNSCKLYLGEVSCWF